MSTPIPEPERYRLLSSWCDGSIADDEIEKLDELLRADAGFRRTFLAYMDQHALLAEDDLAIGAPPLPGGDDGIDAWRGGRTARSDSSPGPASWRRGPRLCGAGFLVAAVVLLLLGLAVLSRPRGPGDAPAPGAPTREGTSADGVALVTRLEAAVWERGDRTGLLEGTILAPGRFRLRSGRATLSFFNGVTLTLEGPADVDLVSCERVFCRRGKLRARIPEGAEGFVIASPGSAVVDLGTELALNVEADGTSRVMVFEGLAEAALLDEAGSPGRTQLVKMREAFAIDPRTGRIDETVARPDRFVPVPDLAASSLVLDPGYAAAVLESRPRGYWRFEAQAGDAFPNEVEGGLPLRARGGVGVAGGSEGSGCALFKADAPDQFLTTDGPWDLPREPGHAVEFWFSADGYSHASLVGLHPPEESFPPEVMHRYVHTFLVETTARGRQSLNKPASVRYLHRWPLNVNVGNNLFSEKIFIPRAWHHVVAQKDGGRMELYLDGVREHSMALEPDHPNLPCRLIVGRRAPDPLLTSDVRSFVGRLDELAIYDHPLTEEEVRRHFRLATTRALTGRARPAAVGVDEFIAP